MSLSFLSYSYVICLGLSHTAHPVTLDRSELHPLSRLFSAFPRGIISISYPPSLACLVVELSCLFLIHRYINYRDVFVTTTIFPLVGEATSTCPQILRSIDATVLANQMVARTRCLGAFHLFEVPNPCGDPLVLLFHIALIAPIRFPHCVHVQMIRQLPKHRTPGSPWVHKKKLSSGFCLPTFQPDPLLC